MKDFRAFDESLYHRMKLHRCRQLTGSIESQEIFKVEEVLFGDLGLNKPNCVSASKQSLHDPFVEPFQLRIV
jgi:hypothetical protein